MGVKVWGGEGAEGGEFGRRYLVRYLSSRIRSSSRSSFRTFKRVRRMLTGWDQLADDDEVDCREKRIRVGLVRSLGYYQGAVQDCNKDRLSYLMMINLKKMLVCDRWVHAATEAECTRVPEGVKVNEVTTHILIPFLYPVRDIHQKDQSISQPRSRIGLRGLSERSDYISYCYYTAHSP